jgi:hypothetical protein
MKGCFGGTSHKKKEKLMLYVKADGKKVFGKRSRGYGKKGTAGHKLWKKYH